jgi:hypothetical protein
MIPVRHYAREIETRWAALLERPAVLGERDWSVICDWHSRGIPLPLIGEAFDQYSEKLRRRRSRPRNLGALVPWVEDAWRTVRGGQSEPTETAPVAPEAGEQPIAAWERCAAALPQDDPLGAWLRDLIERFARGESARSCEEALQAGLLAHLGDNIRADLERGVKTDLTAFRDRMRPEIWDRTRDRALLSAARRRLGLAALSDPIPSHPPDETF